MCIRDRHLKGCLKAHGTPEPRPLCEINFNTNGIGGVNMGLFRARLTSGPGRGFRC